MDRGFIGLLILAVLVVIVILFEAIGLTSTAVTWSFICIGIIYHTIYTIYTIIKAHNRPRFRNKRRCNLRAPGDGSRKNSTDWPY